jgi:threonine/homoserine/homoserine lactone efflux protein
MTRLLIESIIIGLTIAAPVGPIGILCIRRTLVRGFLHGFISGLGAATADALYGSIIAFGLTALSSYLLNASLGLNIVGGLFLLYLGITTMRTPPTSGTSQTPASSTLLKDYLSTFALTVTNPMTILAFIGIFAGLGQSTNTNAHNPFIIVAGVFLGSALWWLLLNSSANLLRHRMTEDIMLWVNRISGLVITLFALNILLKATSL